MPRETAERALAPTGHERSIASVRGMSIVEVLCACALLSFLLLPIFQLVLGASGDTRRTELHLRALLLAQQKLEEALLLGATEAAELPEADVGRFHVRVDVNPYQGMDDLHDFSAQVSWRDGRGAPKKVLLRTLACEAGL